MAIYNKVIGGGLCMLLMGCASTDGPLELTADGRLKDPRVSTVARAIYNTIDEPEVVTINGVRYTITGGLSPTGEPMLVTEANGSAVNHLEPNTTNFDTKQYMKQTELLMIMYGLILAGRDGQNYTPQSDVNVDQ